MDKQVNQCHPVFLEVRSPGRVINCAQCSVGAVVSPPIGRQHWRGRADYNPQRAERALLPGPPWAGGGGCSSEYYAGFEQTP
ncbi:hypothetical protein scyTo_0011269 [Scyliorhinus torazame]|uniref:Uncharacterized protein n=1 Tax=Scyliorhinus torazame TaxID=75743 RepID=A0A401NJZ3_SCYTO|nr:hypothetical protein [Scyliorhinus torazame]